MNEHLTKEQDRNDISALGNIFADPDIRFELERPIPNFVRAAMLASDHNYPEDKVRCLQRIALNQYALGHRNYEGFWVLVREYKFSGDEITECLGNKEYTQYVQVTTEFHPGWMPPVPGARVKPTAIFNVFRQFLKIFKKR